MSRHARPPRIPRPAKVNALAGCVAVLTVASWVAIAQDTGDRISVHAPAALQQPTPAAAKGIRGVPALAMPTIAPESVPHYPLGTEPGQPTMRAVAPVTQARTPAPCRCTTRTEPPPLAVEPAPEPEPVVAPEPEPEPVPETPAVVVIDPPPAEPEPQPVPEELPVTPDDIQQIIDAALGQPPDPEPVP